MVLLHHWVRYDVSTMVRTQVLLSEEQIAALREMAACQGRSMAALVRDGVDAILEPRQGVTRAEIKRRSLAALGRYRSGIRTLGSRHDEHLAGAFDE
jgi:hypothetical protein